MEFDYRTGDCRELLKTVPDASVRLVVTSPPYNIGKSYGKYKDKIALNDWQDLINDTTKEVCRILTPDGAFFLNLSPVPLGSSKEIIPLPFLGYQIFKDNGLYLRNMITWTFNNMQNCTNRLSGRYENILWGVKDIDNYIFNLDDVRIPYLTKGDKRLAEGGGRNPTDVWYFDRVNNMTPVYNFINDRLVDESAVLRPLSWHLILYVFRYFSRKWQKISDCECPDLIQNETPVRFLYDTQKNVRSDRAESSWHSN